MPRSNAWWIRLARLAGWSCRTWGAAVLVVAAGCGLQEYEARMELQQKRQAYRVEEDKALGEPIHFFEVPTKADGKDGGKDAGAERVKAEEVFFRPPAGISAEPEAKPVGGILGVYKPTGRDSAGAFQEVLVAAIKGEKTAAFQKEVLKQLGVGGSPVGRDVGVGARFGPVHVDCYKDEKDGKSTHVCFHQKNNITVAVAFKTSGKDVGDTNPSVRMDYALGSLALGYDAGRASRAYKPPSKSATGATKSKTK